MTTTATTQADTPKTGQAAFARWLDQFPTADATDAPLELGLKWVDDWEGEEDQPTKT